MSSINTTNKNTKTQTKTIQSLRGMNDIKGDISKKYEYFIKHSSDIAKKYGFNFIQTPVLEKKELFVRSVGNSSDIVNKEMYEFVDKGCNSVCLRPEGTAGIVRSFVQDKQDKAGGVHKYFYYGQMFRYERPQKGRLRCFHQFGLESFGAENVYEDGNIILALCDIFNFFDIKFDIHLNSLGCDKCASDYKNKLLEKLKKIDGLCSDCDERINKNPLRVFDCKNTTCISKINNLSKITDELCESCDSEFNRLKNLLKTNKVDFVVDKNLVRGLDYYTKTAFEFTSLKLGAQNAIAGGGRYDKLLSQLGGAYVASIGCAIGFERIEPLINIINESKNILYIGTTNNALIDTVFNVSAKKRSNNDMQIIGECKRKAFSKHLAIASKQNANFIAIIKQDDNNSYGGNGDDENINTKIWLKDVKNNKEYIFSLEEFNDNSDIYTICPQAK